MKVLLTGRHGQVDWELVARAILGEGAAITPIRSSESKPRGARPIPYSTARVRAVLGDELSDWRALLSDMRKSA